MGEHIYTLTLHRHRLAAWAACTAARTSPNCRFDVESGVQLIELTGLNGLAEGWDALPEPHLFDDAHRGWREALMGAAPGIIEPHAIFTHGVAAKLINCYLKVLFLGGVQEPTSQISIAKRDTIHPPIDRVLLTQLAHMNFNGNGGIWRRLRNLGWSNFSAEEYEEAIAAIRLATHGRLWQIEEHWAGFQ